MMNDPYSHYASVFKVLSDSTRLKIFTLLSDAELCGCDILEQVPITQPTLSYHMKLLCEAGLANERKDGSWKRYTLNCEKVQELQNFLSHCKPTPDSG